MFTILYASLPDWNEVPTTTFLCCTILLLLCVRYKRHGQHDLHKSGLIATAKRLDCEPTDGRHRHMGLRPMPTPTPLPVIGHLHLLRDYPKNPWDGFQVIRKQYGDVVALKMGVHPMALVSSIEAMREVLLDKGEQFANRPDFARHHIIFGGDKENSLALCNWNNIHKDRRKLCKRGIMPSRVSARYHYLLSIVTKRVIYLMDDLLTKRQPHLNATSSTSLNQNQPLPLSIDNQQPQEPSVKLTKEDILFLTTDIFLEFLCSEKASRSDHKYKEFALGCDFVFWDITQMYLIDFLPYLKSFGAGYTYLRKLTKVTDFLRGYINDKIFDVRYKKIEAYLKDKDNNEDNFDEINCDYLDSLILEYMNKQSCMSLADYKVGFADLLAGHAAVANIAMLLLGHLALNQHIQDMISDEAHQIEELYGDSSDRDVPMPIMEAALFEALRLASSPIVPHVACEDTSISGHYVPEGTIVLFNNYYLNLSDHLWNEPYKYDPTRFLSIADDGKSYKLIRPKHFMPFSEGLRQCLGSRMVSTTVLILISNLCKKYVIKANDEDLVRHLVAPTGSAALNPDAACFHLRLFPKRNDE